MPVRPSFTQPARSTRSMRRRKAMRLRVAALTTGVRFGHARERPIIGNIPAICGSRAKEPIARSQSHRQAAAEPRDPSDAFGGYILPVFTSFNGHSDVQAILCGLKF